MDFKKEQIKYKLTYVSESTDDVVCLGVPH
jgi:hypothetical protein